MKHSKTKKVSRYFLAVEKYWIWEEVKKSIGFLLSRRFFCEIEWKMRSFLLSYSEVKIVLRKKWKQNSASKSRRFCYQKEKFKKNEISKRIRRFSSSFSCVTFFYYSFFRFAIADSRVIFFITGNKRSFLNSHKIDGFPSNNV